MALANDQAECPTHLNVQDKGQYLEVQKDMLTIRYTESGRNGSDVGAIRANKPVPTNRLIYYYEVTILKGGDNDKIGVGFTDKVFKLNNQPGWCDNHNSYGYHGDDGQKFHSSGRGEAYSQTFTSGDTVGAGIHLDKQEMFFTKNGKHLGVAFRNVSVAGLYPTIGLHSKNSEVAVNFGQRPFKFDIEALLMDEKLEQQKDIDRVQVPYSALHDVVRDYLTHFGFADTLNAFEMASRGCDDGTASCSSSKDSGAGHELLLRREIRGHVMHGRITSAMDVIACHWPELLSASSAAHSVAFHLHCQQFIEITRSGDPLAAVHYAQQHLAPYHSRSLTDEERTLLKETLALIVYEDIKCCPMRHLLAAEQREKVADIVNSAVLRHIMQRGGHDDDDDDMSGASDTNAGSPAGWHGGSKRRDSGPTPVLEQLLRQLVAARECFREVNGKQGEVFNLHDILFPQED